MESTSLSSKNKNDFSGNKYFFILNKTLNFTLSTEPSRKAFVSSLLASNYKNKLDTPTYNNLKINHLEGQDQQHRCRRRRRRSQQLIHERRRQQTYGISAVTSSSRALSFILTCCIMNHCLKVVSSSSSSPSWATMRQLHDKILPKSFSATSGSAAFLQNFPSFHSLPSMHRKSVYHSSSFSLRSKKWQLQPYIGCNEIKKKNLLSSLYSSSTGSSQRNQPLKSLSSPDQDQDDTIFALSSGGGGETATAVSIIRISGPSSTKILQQLLRKTSDQNPSAISLPKPRMASLKILYDPTTLPSYPKEDPSFSSLIGGVEAEVLDSSLVLYFPRPNSFTGEDVVELHVHGSRAVVSDVLSVLSKLEDQEFNCRPAERGEFTSRAYTNGKLGLCEVEALADLIVSDTSQQRKQALKQLDGRLSRLYSGWREELTKGLAHAEAVIDFGDDEDLLGDDDDEDEEDDYHHNRNKGQLNIWGSVQTSMKQLRGRMNRHLLDSQRGEIVRTGVKVAIVGKPNAGKSSLLNVLANRDAAIVSPIAGTTRDVVEITLDLGGVRCIVSDTAGVRKSKTKVEGREGGTDDENDNIYEEDEDWTGDVIEVEGMKRARRVAEEAHIIVCLADATDGIEGFDVVKDMLGDTECSQTDNQNEIMLENEDGELEASSSSFLVGPEVLYVQNKIDLLDAATESSDGSWRTGEDAVSNDEASLLSSVDNPFAISCTANEGVDDFIEILTERVVSRVAATPLGSSRSEKEEEQDGAVITRARHRHHVELASEALERFDDLSREGYATLDLAAEELRLATSELGRITGAVDVEDVLDVLFADFCIGK
mmetsp:Transcript_68677/g.102082  ORF Transcript_68677/g.102082 Transcript_68677/m.102082 type:complete len:825 (+) Transcript_68677:299-2773(+)